MALGSDHIAVRLLVALASRETAWQLLRLLVVAGAVFASPLGPTRGTIIVCVLYAAWYYFTAAAATRIYIAGSESEQRVLRHMPCLRGRGYYPTPYLVNPHLQTLFAAMGRPLPRVPFLRQLNHDVFPDGEVAIVDWAFATLAEQHAWEARNAAAGRASGVPLQATRAANQSGAARRSFRDARAYNEARQGKRTRSTASFGGPGPHSADVLAEYFEDMAGRLRSGRPPVVVLFHGLTGGHEDLNIYYLAKWILERGWHVAVPVRRGCADCPSYLTRPKHYAYGDIADSVHAVNHIADSMPGHPLFAVGLSAGSNVMCNYMANAGRVSRIYGAVSIANGYCWERGTSAIRDHHPVWDVIMTEIVHSTLYDRHAQVLSGPLSTNGAEPQDPASPVGPNGSFPPAARPRSMREYDAMVSKNLHGYDSLAEFYVAQSCLYRLHRLKHPVVFLNAMDDPLASCDNIPYDSLLRNPNTMLAVTPGGGHLGWATGWWPFRHVPTWMDTFILEALDGLAAEALHRVDRPQAATAYEAAATMRSSGFGGSGGFGTSEEDFDDLAANRFAR